MTSPSKGKVRAARYLRMSTGRQPNSPANQAAVIEVYALSRGYEVIASYEDPATSGVTLRGRPAFREMIGTILAGRADFEVVLVYDVSRFGRFQDPDEAAHYEWLCASEGVRIEYCAEAFGAGLEGALLKGLKRAMAAEYSRELGDKVRSAQRRLTELGHWQHGSPGHGLRRQVVKADGRPGPILQAGEHKADRGEHTILVRGPAREVAQIRRIFARCAKDGRTPDAIAREMNGAGEPGPGGRAWTARQVREILTHPKYAGMLVTQRRTTPIGGRTVKLPADQWARARSGAPKIVTGQTFQRAQAVLASRPRPSDGALLDALRELTASHGVLTEPKLAALGAPFYRAYRRRFGSLRAAYALIGHAPPKHHPKKMDDEAMLAGLAELFLRAGDLTGRLIDADPNIPSADHYRQRFGSLALAYAQIGFVRLSTAELASPVGRARLAAREAVVRRYAKAPASHGRGD